MAKSEKSEKKPIYWILGNYHDCQKKWSQIAAEHKGYNIEVMDCGYNTEKLPAQLRYDQAKDIIELLQSSDMFDDRDRIIKVVGLPTDYTLLNDYLHLVDESNIVVICSPAGYYVPVGTGSRFVTAKTSGLYKQINSWSQIYEFPESAKNRQSAIKWIIATANDVGKSIDEECAGLLVDIKGLGLDDLYGEIIRLRDYCANKKVKKEDVEAVCIPLFTKTVWDLIDSMDRMEHDKCSAHMLSFCDDSTSDSGTSLYSETMKLFGALRQHFMFLTLVKSRCGDRININTAMDAVKDMKKLSEDKDMFDYNFVRFNLEKDGVRTALMWPVGKLHGVLLDLFRCECACRYHSNDEQYISKSLMSFVAYVCGKIRIEDSARVRGKFLGVIQ